MNLLTKRGPSAFQSFIKALCSTDQKHLATKLISDYESITGPNTAQNLCGDNSSSGNNNMHYMNSNLDDPIVPLCFSLQSSPMSFKNSKSKPTDITPKKRAASENEDCSPAYVHRENSNMSPAKKRYPSSITHSKLDATSPNSLDDLLSTTSLDDLSAASQLKKPKENMISNDNPQNTQSLDIDLIDGPTRRDVTVRRLGSHQVRL